MLHALIIAGFAFVGLLFLADLLSKPMTSTRLALLAALAIMLIWYGSANGMFTPDVM